jgi:pimeloyl-ACP methyl ester carboxylesterase
MARRVVLVAVCCVIAAVAPAEASGQPERGLAWKRCRDAPTAQCATLRVPVNWAHPRGPRIGLALARIRAADRERRVGSLLFNCGGPGCPSAQLVKLIPQTFTERLRRRFDIVGFDPRGIGESAPLRCGVPISDTSIPTFPTTAAGYRRLVDRNRALARSCRRLTGPLLMHVGAPATVRDMEAIRTALDDGKLNWLGLSYGTLLGAEYAYRYPRRVRTLALDGALDHSQGEPAMLGAEGRAAEDVFNRWAAWCNASPECPLQGQDPARVFDELVAAANRSPIPAEGVDRGVTGEEIQNNAGGYLLFTRPTEAFGPASWRTLGPAIVQARGGDASAFATPPPDPPADPAYGEQAVECLDFPAQTRSFADLTAKATFARIVAPHLGGAVQTARILSKCIGWPKPRVNPRRFRYVRHAPPSLIVNATHDPSTSYAWALAMRIQIERSTLLTREGDGHTSYLSSPCAQAAIDRYLISRVRPRPGSVCVE